MYSGVNCDYANRLVTLKSVSQGSKFIGGGGSATEAATSSVQGSGDGRSGGIGEGGNAGGLGCNYNGNEAGGMGWYSDGQDDQCTGDSKGVRKFSIAFFASFGKCYD